MPIYAHSSQGYDYYRLQLHHKEPGLRGSFPLVPYVWCDALE